MRNQRKNERKSGDNQTLKDKKNVYGIIHFPVENFWIMDGILVDVKRKISVIEDTL